MLESDETFQRETDTTSLTVDARPYRTYSFFVSAKTVVGYGPFGTDVIIRTPESGEYPPTISHAPWARGCIYKIVLLPVFRVLAHDQSHPPPPPPPPLFLLLLAFRLLERGGGLDSRLGCVFTCMGSCFTRPFLLSFISAQLPAMYLRTLVRKSLGRTVSD